MSVSEDMVEFNEDILPIFWTIIQKVVIIYYNFGSPPPSPLHSEQRE